MSAGELNQYRVSISWNLDNFTGAPRISGSAQSRPQADCRIGDGRFEDCQEEKPKAGGKSLCFALGLVANVLC